MNTFAGKIVILNGPPKSGKDTIYEVLDNYSSFKHKEFKAGLYPIVAGIIGMDLAKFMQLYLTDRNWKETFTFLGFTIRELMIFASEVVMKPKFGKAVFGNLAANSISEAEFLHKGILFTDGGFIEELAPLADKFGVENIIVVRLHRAGYTFGGDSRAYLTKDMLGNIPSFDFYNTQDNVSEMVKVFTEQLNSFVNQIRQYGS